MKQRHLLQKHLHAGQLDLVKGHVSDRARRVDSALKLLGLVEAKAGSIEAVEGIIDRMLKEA